MARLTKGWFRRLGRKFQTSCQKDIIVLHSTSPAEAQSNDEASDFEREISSSPRRRLTLEDVAAIKIQAVFRAHLARRAFGALRSLVKVQALVRGAYVRKQSRLALQCMHALVRLQVRIRARQLLGKCNDAY